jgi:hypothetical protein
MFTRKYKATLMYSKWEVLKKDLKFTIIPKKNEYIFFDGAYYLVVSVIHVMNKNQLIYIIVEEQENK